MLISETEQRYRRFWEEFVEYLRINRNSLSPPSPRGENHMNFSRGSSLHIAAVLSVQRGDIGIRLRMKGENAREHFDRLKELKEEIEKEVGERLEWDELPHTESSTIFLRKEGTDPANETDWHNQHEWLASKLEMFDRVFPKRIR